MVKIQVDGAVAKSQNKGSYAAICRDEQGNFLGASSVTREGITDPEVLESLACVEALCLAKDLNEIRLNITTDCSNIVKEIHGGGMRGASGTTVREIKVRRDEFQEVIFGFERRAANGEAHRLARMATTLDIGRRVWFSN